MATKPSFEQLLEAGCHFGHLKRKWNPAMAPYIFMERNGIHIIDLYKTQAKIEEAANALKNIAKSGKRVLFVATKKQAKKVIEDKAKSVGMPFVIERWPGGMLTNFPSSLPIIPSSMPMCCLTMPMAVAISISAAAAISILWRVRWPTV